MTFRDLHLHFGCEDGRLRAIDDGIKRLETAMVTVSDELAQSEQSFAALSTAVTTELQALTDEVAKLKADLAAVGQLMPEDQARFDALQEKMQALTDQVSAAAPDAGTGTGGGGDGGGDGSTDTGNTVPDAA